MEGKGRVLKVVKPFRVLTEDGRLLVHNMPGVMLDAMPLDEAAELLALAPDAVEHVGYQECGGAILKNMSKSAYKDSRFSGEWWRGSRVR